MTPTVIAESLKATSASQMRWCSGQQFPPPSVGLAGDRCVVKNERQSKMKRTKVSATGPVKCTLAADEITRRRCCCSRRDPRAGTHWGSLVARRGMYTHTVHLSSGKRQSENCFSRNVEPPPGIWSLSDGSNIEWWRGRSSNTITMFRNKRRQIFTRCAGVFFNYARPGGGVGCCWLYVQGSCCQRAQNAHERSTWVSLAVFIIPNKTVEKCKAHGDLNFGGSAQRLLRKPR